MRNDEPGKIEKKRGAGAQEATKSSRQPLIEIIKAKNEK
jgi:hypothetical protein